MVEIVTYLKISDAIASYLPCMQEENKEDQLRLRICLMMSVHGRISASMLFEHVGTLITIVLGSM